MKWTRFRIQTTTEAEDLIISFLYDLGLEGAQIEDKVPMSAWEKEQMFVDIPPMMGEDDGIAWLSFFAEQGEDGFLKLGEGATSWAEDPEHLETEQVLARIREELEMISGFSDIGEGTVMVDETEDLDWINNWKQYFHKFTIDDLLVIPSWETEDVPEGTKVLHIDPGTAFGTGMHETTQLCIRAIRKNLTRDAAILDVGTGSGILGIIGLMYGAAKVVGTDLDPCAVPAVEDNLAKNGMADADFELIIGNIITDTAIGDKAGYGCYDMVCANILADVLVPLTPVIVPHLKEGGIYITSGIIDDKEEVVKAAIEAAGLTVLEVAHQGEWVGITARK